MSDEPSEKRRKMNNYKKSYQNSNKAKNCLEPGLRGFFATCNFAEKECVRECYNLLNEYVDEKPTEQANQGANETEKLQSKEMLNDSGTAGGEADDDEEEEDISTMLQKEIKTITSAKQDNRNRFQQVDTGVQNCIFIKTTIPDPNELGVRIVRDIAETKKRKTRMLLRFLPVDAVCRANIEDIKNAAGKLFDKVFLNAEPIKYSVIFNKRYNNNVDRMAVIHELATLIDFKSSAHKVDLKNPQITVIVEIIKGLCCISILPDFLKLKKYNLHELTSNEKPANEGAKAAGQDEAKKEETSSEKEPEQEQKETVPVEQTQEESTPNEAAPIEAPSNDTGDDAK